jgi:hypothetical protein
MPLVRTSPRTSHRFPLRRFTFVGLAFVPLLPFAALAVGACANLLSIDGPVVIKGADASPNAYGIPAGTPTCQACLASQCRDQATACAQNSACAMYESCNVPCGADYACRSACTGDQARAPEISALDQCLVASCEAACGVQCGLTAALPEPDAAVACKQCMVASPNDCAVVEACAKNLECVEIAGCVSKCPTPDCQQACTVGKDAGAALIAPLVTALAGSCVAACEYGGNWGCIGKVTDPAPTGPIQLTMNVQSLVSASAMPLAGVHVVACAAADALCTTPVASADTDGEGNALLAISPAVGGFIGHLEIKAPGDGGADSFEPVLYYLAYRLSAPASTLQANLFTYSFFDSELSLAGTTIDPDAGTAVVAAYDCSLDLAPNVAFQASGTNAKFLYLAGTLFSASATETGSNGFAVLPNVTPGAITLSATPTAVGRASSSVPVEVRKGWISFVGLFPN